MPGGLLYKRAVVLADIQSAEGAAATLNPSLHAILVKNLTWNPNGEIIERDFLRDSLSPLPHRMGRKLSVANLTFELKAGQQIGARPEWSPLIRAAGMSETVTSAVVTSIRTAALRWTLSVAGGAGVYWVELAAGGDPTITNPQVVRENGDDMRRASALASLRKGEFIYGDFDTLGFSTIYVKLSDEADPDSKAFNYVERVASATNIIWNFRDSGFEFATVGIYRDGKLYNCVDSLLDITSITYNAGGTVEVQARLTADYATPTDTALPAGLYQQHLPPLAESMAFSFDAFAAGVVSNFSVNFANELSERRDLNSPFGFKGMRYTGRKPTGQVTMEQELVADFPAITRWENATEMAWSAVLGTSPQRLTFTGPSVQITGEPTEVDVNEGLLGWQLPLRFNAPGTTKEFQIKQD